MTLSDGLGDDDSENWEPLATLDYVLLIVASLHQALVLGVVVHLVWCRSWPPYVVKNMPLVCVTGVAGIINMVGVVISKGFLNYEEPSFLSNCFLHGFMTWTGSGLYYGAAVVRVYRNYRVLIHHNADMMHPISQIMVVQMPIWLMTFPLLSPSIASMNYDTNRCDGYVKNILLGAFNYAGVLLLGATYLLWEMRHVRKQMNEYWVMMMTLGFLMVSVVVLDASAGCFSSDGAMTRRVALLNNFVRSAILFWPIIFTPLLKYAVQDAGYAERFAMGKKRMLTPSRLSASLSEQLRVDEIWVHFRKIAEEKMDPAFPSFYKVVMDRDMEQGYLKRQAKTMDIIDTYIADNATMRLRVSDGVRERILASEVTRDDIFQEAANEVLFAMREKCEEAFRSSGVCAQLLSKLEWDKMESPNKAKGIDTTSCTGYGARNASCDNRRGWWHCIPWSWCLHGRRRSTPSLEHKLARGRHGACIVSSASGLSNGMVGSRSNSALVPSPAVNTIRSELKGPSSSVPRLDDEDIERGSAMGTDGINSRTPSVFKEGRSFGAPTTATTTATESAFRTSMGASPSRLSTRSSLALSSSLAFSSAESSPLSLLLSRSDVTSNPSSKRLPLMPWAPWRRTPEPPPIAPSMNSPSSEEEGQESCHHEQEHFYGDEKADVMESGEMVADFEGLGVVRPAEREDADILFSRGGVVPSSSQSSMVMLMPPSPATPKSTGSSMSGSGGGSVGRCRGRLGSSLAAVEEARDGGGGGGDVCVSRPVVGVNGPRRRYHGGQSWMASWVSGWRGDTIVEEKDASSVKVEVEESYGSCAEFAAATGYVPTEGFVPSMRLLEVAMAKEGEEKKRVEVARSLIKMGGVFSDVEEDEEEVSEESWEDRKESESEVEVVEAEGEARAEGYWEFQIEETRRVPQEVPVSTVVKSVKGDRQGSPFSSSGDTERMESGLTCFSSGGSSERGDVDRGSGEVVPNAARAVDLVPQSPKVPVIPPSVGGDEVSERVGGEEWRRDDEVVVQPRLSPSRLSPSTLQSSKSRPSVLPVDPSKSPSPSGQSYQVPEVSNQSYQEPEVSDESYQLPRDSDQSTLCPPSDAMVVETKATHNVAVRKEDGIDGVESSCRNRDDLLSSSVSTAPGDSNPSRSAFEGREQDHPQPKTPPRATSIAGGLERRAPPKMATRDRALVVAAVRAKAQAQITQLSAASQVGKGSGPACAQPARAPPWGDSSVAESLSDSSSRDAMYESSSAGGLFSSGVGLLNPLGQTGMQRPLSPPPKTPPPIPPPLLPLNLVAVGAPSHVTYAPPSPSGWSNSGSPSSVKSSPVFVRAPPPCHHFHYNQQQAGTAGLPPAVRSWREGFTTSGTVASLAWSWSDSTLSGCSRSGGFGGGMSSVSASVCSEYTSPLVGMKFVEADAPEDGGSSSVRTRGRSRSTSGSGALGMSELPLMGVRGSPPLLAVEGEAKGKCVGSSKPAVSVPVPVSAAAPKDRNATGSEAKRRRRFFFP